MKFEWTDQYKALNDALRALNIILLETLDLEETAKQEAKIVKNRLDLGNLSKAELIDYTNQAAIDLLSFRRKLK